MRNVFPVYTKLQSHPTTRLYVCLTCEAQLETDVQVRQLAAVELRKRIASSDGRLWRKVNQDVRKQMKEDLLRRLVVEQV